MLSVTCLLQDNSGVDMRKWGTRTEGDHLDGGGEGEKGPQVSRVCAAVAEVCRLSCKAARKAAQHACLWKDRSHLLELLSNQTPSSYRSAFLAACVGRVKDLHQL